MSQTYASILSAKNKLKSRQNDSYRSKLSNEQPNSRLWSVSKARTHQRLVLWRSISASDLVKAPMLSTLVASLFW